MTIPKVIHFIAPEDRTQWHPIWHRCYQSWIDQHPDFEIKLWNDTTDIDDLVKEFVPHYYDTFCRFPYKMMKMNYIRFILLYYFGGIYSDIDIFSYKNFYDKLSKNDFFALENSFNETTLQHAPMETCLMASSQYGDFVKNCIDNIINKFIHFEPLFEKRSIQKQWLNVQTTSFPILLETRDPHKPDQISLLNYFNYNNRAHSYDDAFYTKHMRTASWLSNDSEPTHYFMTGPMIFSIDKKKDAFNSLVGKMNQIDQTYTVTPIEDFNFYYDYSEGNYFRGDSSDKDLKKRIKQLYQYLVN